MNADVVVDAGNSFIKWGRCSAGAVVETARLPSADPRDWHSLLVRWQLKDACQWVVAGSDPACRDRMADWLHKQNQIVRVLNSYAQLPITVNVEQPEKVGLDRLLNAVAVNTRKPRGAAAVVIDAGTAVTVDYLDEAGVFQGGAILPGVGIMAGLLHEHTAALPRMEPEEWKQLTRSATLPGKSTVEAMALGIAASFHGGVEHIAREYIKKATHRTVCYIGGGDASLVDAGFSLSESHVWPEMTLEGIRITGTQPR